MDDEDDDLWTRFLEAPGALGAAEDGRLRGVLEADPQVRARRMADLRIDGVLRSLLRAQHDDQLFLRRLDAASRAGGDEIRFVTGLRRRLGRRRLARRIVRVVAPLLAAAVVVLAVGRWRVLRRVALEGDVQVFRGADAIEPALVRRGDRIRVGPGGARLSLGRCCTLDLASAEVTLVGQAGREAVALGGGTVHARVAKDRGGFRVDTPLGTVEVVGTEFSTQVIRVGGKGTATGTRTWVRVGVAEGRVRCRFGAQSVLVDQGASRVFGGDNRSGTSEALIAAAGERTLRIRIGDDEMDVDVVSAESRVGARRMAIGAWPVAGDIVQVSWVVGDGGFAVTDLRGRTVGRVTAVRGDNLEIETAEGRRRTFLAGWVAVGRVPEDGARQIAASQVAIARQEVGRRVEVFWAMTEGLRVVDVQPRD